MKINNIIDLTEDELEMIKFEIANYGMACVMDSVIFKETQKFLETQNV